MRWWEVAVILAAFLSLASCAMFLYRRRKSMPAFPSNPVPDQQVVIQGVTFVYTPYGGWKQISSRPTIGGAIPALYAANLLLAGAEGKGTSVVPSGSTVTIGNRLITFSSLVTGGPDIIRMSGPLTIRQAVEAVHRFITGDTPGEDDPYVFLSYQGPHNQVSSRFLDYKDAYLLIESLVPGPDGNAIETASTFEEFHFSSPTLTGGAVTRPAQDTDYLRNVPALLSDRQKRETRESLGLLNRPEIEKLVDDALGAQILGLPSYEYNGLPAPKTVLAAHNRNVMGLELPNEDLVSAVWEERTLRAVFRPEQTVKDKIAARVGLVTQDSPICAGVRYGETAGAASENLSGRVFAVDALRLITEVDEELIGSQIGDLYVELYSDDLFLPAPGVTAVDGLHLVLGTIIGTIIVPGGQGAKFSLVASPAPNMPGSTMEAGGLIAGSSESSRVWSRRLDTPDSNFQPTLANDDLDGPAHSIGMGRDDRRSEFAYFVAMFGEPPALLLHTQWDIHLTETSRFYPGRLTSTPDTMSMPQTRVLQEPITANTDILLIGGGHYTFQIADGDCAVAYDSGSASGQYIQYPGSTGGVHTFTDYAPPSGKIRVVHSTDALFSCHLISEADA